MQTAKRHYGLDILRILACYMVIQVHAGEFYYIGPVGEVLNTPEAQIVGWINSLFRSCVPLFVMLSGYFLFPVNDTKQFLTKRLTTILIPFVIWSVLYAFYQYGRGVTSLQDAFINVAMIPLNLAMETGHLWFVYMLIGIYLFAPIISGWMEKSTKQEMHYYIFFWVITLIVPFIHQLFPYIWGEVPWNNHPMLHYFMGYMGYVVVANYLKKVHQPSTNSYIFAIALIVVGYAITTFGFLYRLPTQHTIADLELTWDFNTINIAMMTVGIFILVKDIAIEKQDSYGISLLQDLSAKSYGMYLAHIMLLNFVHGLMIPLELSLYLKIPLVAIVTFILTYMVVKLISYLPKSKWIVG
ncbi:MAG: acyltransferase family protein [Cytophagaceae bacterium]